MNCPNCNKNVNELEEKCPVCGYILKCNINEEEINSTKTILLRFINALQLIGCIIAGIVLLKGEATLLGFVTFAGGLITFAFIKGFSDIIDLLDSINDKLDK